MPIFKEIIESNYSIYIWKVSETGDELANKLPKNVNEFVLRNNKLQKRKIEKWVQSHLLIHAKIEPLLLSYAASGKPFIRNSLQNISFSHSGKYAVLMIGNAPCGIDIERENPKIERISPKFLNQYDKQFLTQSGALNWIWSIKEAVFKYFGANVIFKDDIIIDRLNPDTMNAQVSYNGFYGIGKFEINLDRFGNYYLAYTKAYHKQ